MVYSSLRLFLLPLGIALLTPLAVDDAQAQRRGAEENARQQMLDGQVKSLKEIEAAVLPRMKGMTYLGPEFDPRTRIYRLKFIRDNNHVVFVDVDGRTGRILRQRG
ncbi:MAG: hypothetical protein AAFX04_07550 [Pseudomonadota bacterium]